MDADEPDEEAAGEKLKPKQLLFVAGSQKDLQKFPDEVRQVMGYALWQAQQGGKHPSAKVLKGYGGAGVLEIVDDYDGDTYRGVYTVKFSNAVYLLDAFQKKSKKGSKTPPADINRIKTRLDAAEQHHKQWKLSQQKKG